MTETCKDCRYFYYVPGRAYAGPDIPNIQVTVCRRYPEQVLREMTDWCGEFKLAIPEDLL